MSQSDTPILHQRRLRAELRNLRESAQLTQKDVADRLEWSVSKVIRIENGSTNVGTTDLRALLMLYNVTDEQKIKQLIEEGRASRQSAWWTRFRPLIDPQLYVFIGYEASATRIRQYQSLTMPGLLQTPEYTTALVTAYSGDPAKVELGVSLRRERQRIVTSSGPRLEFVLDEAILRRNVGGAEVMRDQLRHIVGKSHLANISIRVLRFNARGHIGLRGSFSILDLTGFEDEYILVLEEAVRDVLIRDDKKEIRKYVDAFKPLQDLALEEDESIAFIESLIAELDG